MLPMRTKVLSFGITALAMVLSTAFCTKYRERGYRGPLYDAEVSLFELESNKLCTIQFASGASSLKVDCEKLKDFVHASSPLCQKHPEDQAHFAFFPGQQMPMRLCRDYQSPDLSEKEVIRFFILGDIGVGENLGKNQRQQTVAQAMLSVCPPDFGGGFAATQPSCNFALIVGDLIYPNGVSSVWDNQLKAKFEDVYATFGDMPFYMLPGNHDYKGSVQAALDYTYFSPRWRMLERSYSLPSLPSWLNIFGLDTQGMMGEYDSPARWDLQKQQLSASFCGKPGWRILAGHYPAYASGFHGSNATMATMLEDFHRECPFQTYFAGHEHHLEHLQGPNFDQFIQGGGGAEVKEVSALNEGASSAGLTQAFAAAQHGFAVVEARAESLDVYVFDLSVAQERSLEFDDYAYHCRLTHDEPSCIPQ